MVHETLLGQMILDKHVYYSANLPAECFPPGQLRQVYRTIAKRYELGDAVDLTLLARDLPDVPAYEIAKLTDCVSTSANWEYYATEARREWKASQLRSIAMELQERVADPDIIEWIYGKLSRVADDGRAEIVRAPKMVSDLVGLLEERYKLRGKLPGLSTGIRELDNMLLGLKPRMLYYIGSRPADGKTALCITLIANLCRAGAGVGVLSLESSRHELMGRLFSNVGSIDNRDLVTGSVGGDFSRITTAAERIHDWRLSICDRENMDIGTIRAKAREMVRAEGAQVLFLDYLQLVRQTNTRQEFRLHMNEASMTMKQLARELNVPVVVAAQLGRGAQDTEPKLSDFKESGQIEQDADAAILIWHERTDYGVITASNLKVAKNRDGQTGTFGVTFQPAIMRFAGSTR